MLFHLASRTFGTILVASLLTSIPTLALTPIDFGAWEHRSNPVPPQAVKPPNIATVSDPIGDTLGPGSHNSILANSQLQLILPKRTF